jgi:hypothetical protein
MAPRTLPTDAQLDALDRQLLDLTRTATAWLAELAVARTLCAEHPSRPDGFPRSASGADRSATTGGGGRVELDEDGQPLPPVELTSVESAAEARAHHRDRLEQSVLDGVVGLERAISGMQALGAAVAAFGALRKPEPVDTANAEVGCWVLARVGHHEPTYATSTLNGLLDVERPVGRWAYDFAREVGRLPTLDECEQRAVRRTVRLAQVPPR